MSVAAQGKDIGILIADLGINERNARLIAMLDVFEEGDAEEQCRDFAALQAGVEEARPGQRQVFGEGFNL